MMDHHPNDVFLARWLYESFAMITSQTLGPGWRILPHAEKVAEVLRPALDAVVAQEVQVEPGKIWEFLVHGMPHYT